ncbi:MAG: L-fuculose-phosphate aldolase [Candidatus Krumholzibacteriia bacterium]|jgi:L-fuculose-phosphate aldolase
MNVTNLVLLRREMVSTGQKMQDRGFVVAAEGNLSVRVSGHCFLVSPAGVNKGQMRVQDLVEVDTEGRTARGTPTSEWPLHREIYLQRPDVRGICHAHCAWSTAFAAAGRDLDGSLLTETAALLPRVPLAARAEPGTAALAASIRPHVASYNAILLGNHGVVTMGSDLAAAFALMETVERLAQVTLLKELAAGESTIDPAKLEQLSKNDHSQY